jgi:sarcosine oxidase subunit gamma
MQTVIQKSPVSHVQRYLAPKIGVLHEMEVALEFGGGALEDAHKRTLGICDVSCFPRCGIKGTNVLQWLSEQKIEIPAQPNSWIQHPNGTLVLRLGGSEFLIEEPNGSQLCEQLKIANRERPYGVFKVQRADTALLLSGTEVTNLFSEVCSIDLRGQALDDNRLVMTQVAGISATLIRQTLNGEPVYRLWCDGTFGAYMWETLLEIAQELGGGAVGLSRHFKELI